MENNSIVKVEVCVVSAISHALSLTLLHAGINFKALGEVLQAYITIKALNLSRYLCVRMHNKYNLLLNGV